MSDASDVGHRDAFPGQDSLAASGREPATATADLDEAGLDKAVGQVWATAAEPEGSAEAEPAPFDTHGDEGVRTSAAERPGWKRIFGLS